MTDDPIEFTAKLTGYRSAVEAAIRFIGDLCGGGFVHDRFKLTCATPLAVDMLPMTDGLRVSFDVPWPVAEVTFGPFKKRGHVRHLLVMPTRLKLEIDGLPDVTLEIE